MKTGGPHVDPDRVILLTCYMQKRNECVHIQINAFSQERHKKTRFTAEPPRNLMFGFGFRGPVMASNCCHVVGFEYIIANGHSHVFRDLLYPG